MSLGATYVQILTLLFTFTLQDSAGERTFTYERGSKPEYQEKPPDNQSENRYHIIIRGEKSPPRPGNRTLAL